MPACSAKAFESAGSAPGLSGKSPVFVRAQRGRAERVGQRAIVNQHAWVAGLDVHAVLRVDHEARAFGQTLELGALRLEQAMRCFRRALELELALAAVDANAEQRSELGRGDRKPMCGIHRTEHDVTADHGARLSDDAVDFSALHERSLRA